METILIFSSSLGTGQFDNSNKIGLPEGNWPGEGLLHTLEMSATK